MPDVEGRLRVYWRVGSAKKIARRYRKGWLARHMQWDPSGERVIVLWERSSEPMILRLCETDSLILRTDRTYRFVADPNCERCVELAKTYESERA